MSSLAVEKSLFTVPDGAILAPKIDEINVRQGTFTHVDISDTINNKTITGDFVFTESNQIVMSKYFDDATTAFVDTADNTIRAMINCAGSTGTKSTVRFVQSTDRIYTVPDASNCSFVLTEGAATVNGAKTFSNLTANAFTADGVSERTTGAGFTVAGARLIVGPTIRFTGTGTTVGATSTVLATISTTTDHSYRLTATAIGRTSTVNVVTICKSVRAKNVSGTVTVGTPFNIYIDNDAPLASGDIAFATVGTDITLSGVGVAGTTINWACEVEILHI